METAKTRMLLEQPRARRTGTPTPMGEQATATGTPSAESTPRFGALGGLMGGNRQARSLDQLYKRMSEADRESMFRQFFGDQYDSMIQQRNRQVSPKDEMRPRRRAMDMARQPTTPRPAPVPPVVTPPTPETKVSNATATEVTRARGGGPGSTIGAGASGQANRVTDQPTRNYQQTR